MLQKLNIKSKLLTYFLAICIIPVLIVLYITISRAQAEFEDQAVNQLTAVAQIKKNQLVDYFNAKRNEVLVYANNSAVVLATERFINTYNEGGLYSEGWNEWDNFHGTKLAKFAELNGYYDLFIISATGDIVFSAAKGKDLGENLRYGSLSKSGLAKAFNNATSEFAFADFEWYGPSDAPAAFIAAPIKDSKSGYVGVLALQISISKVNEIMQERTGLGETGETYLVGPDYLMRSDSFIDSENRTILASFKGTVEANGVKTTATENVFEGKSGVEFIKDYNDNHVLSAYSPVELPGGVTWAFIAEINEKEIFHAGTDMMINALILFVIVVSIVVAVGIFISNKFTKPIISLAKAAKKVAAGDTSIVLKKESDDELGDLSVSFNKMVESIERQLEYLNGLPTPVMLVDTELNIQYMNRNGAELVGKTQEELKGKKCYDMFNTDHCQTEECSCIRAMKDGKAVTKETVCHLKEKDVPIMYTGSPVRDKEGNIIGALEYVADITEIKGIQDYLNRSTKNMLVEMEKFAKGDLTVNLVPEKEGDDIAKLYNGFNTAVQNIKRMILTVTEVVQSTTSASEQISSGTEELASGAQEQSVQAAEIASAIEQMANTIVENASNATRATESSKEANEQVRFGNNKVHENKKGIERIIESTESTAVIIGSLAGKTDKIGEITQVIDDIADQTNLLALNAAIEAARAGDQGRGFAVVADEVRKLAERTTGATKEIAETIKAIQHEAKDADTSMGSAKQAVLDGKKITEELEEVLNSILNSAENVAAEIEQIATASEEQSTTAEQISKNIEAISSVSNQSASGTQQIAATAEELSNLTQNLQQLILQFKIEQGQAAIGMGNNGNGHNGNGKGYLLHQDYDVNVNT